MTQKLILINGFGGSGKTEVGRSLLDALPSAALFDFDSLTSVNPFEYGEPLFQLGHRNAADITNNFLSDDYQNIIMCGGCGAQRHLDNFLSLLPNHPYVFWFFLVTSAEERRRRKIARSRDGADKPEWFDFLAAKEGPYGGPVKGSRLRASEIQTDGKGLDEVMLELKMILEQNAG